MWLMPALKSCLTFILLELWAHITISSRNLHFLTRTLCSMKDTCHCILGPVINPFIIPIPGMLRFFEKHLILAWDKLYPFVPTVPW